MFESTAWLLEEPDVPELTNYEILTPTIVKPKGSANINVDDLHVNIFLNFFACILRHTGAKNSVS